MIQNANAVQEPCRVVIRVSGAKELLKKGWPESVNVIAENSLLVSDGSVFSQKIVDAALHKECTESEVYEKLSVIVDDVRHGHSVTFIAAGQTGSGKTHTLFGKPFTTPPSVDRIHLSPQELIQQLDLEYDSPIWHEEVGLAPRFAAQLLNPPAEFAAQWETQVYMSFCEVYSERLCDLLNSNEATRVVSEIRIDKNGQVYVPSQTMAMVERPENVLQLIQEGNARRTRSQANYSRFSTRSTAVLQFVVIHTKKTHGARDELIRYRHQRKSKVTFVDLASIEHWNSLNEPQPEVTPDASLTALCNVMKSLAVAQQPVYTNTLTQLLRDTIGGTSRCVVLGLVSPAAVHGPITSRTLQFCDLSQKVVTFPRPLEILDDRTLIKKYEAELTRYRLMLRERQLERNWRKVAEHATRKCWALTREKNTLSKLLTEATKAHDGEGNSEALRVASQSLDKKVQVLNDIETEFRQRAQELNELRGFLLHTLEMKQQELEAENKVPDAENEVQLALIEKIGVLEKALEVCGRDLERSQRVFRRDIDVLRDELLQRNRQIGKLVQNEQILREELEALNTELAACNEQLMGTAASKPISESDKSNGKTFRQLCLGLNNEITYGIKVLQSDLSQMISEYLLGSLEKTFRRETGAEELNKEEIKMQLDGLVEGCCEALTEMIDDKHTSFSQNIWSVVLSLLQGRKVTGNAAAELRKEERQILEDMKRCSESQSLNLMAEPPMGIDTLMDFTDRSRLTDGTTSHIFMKNTLNDDGTSEWLKDSTMILKDYWTRLIDETEVTRRAQTELRFVAHSARNALQKMASIAGDCCSKVRTQAAANLTNRTAAAHAGLGALAGGVRNVPDSLSEMEQVLVGALIDIELRKEAEVMKSSMNDPVVGAVQGVLDYISQGEKYDISTSLTELEYWLRYLQSVCKSTEVVCDKVESIGFLGSGKTGIGVVDAPTAVSAVLKHPNLLGLISGDGLPLLDVTNTTKSELEVDSTITMAPAEAPPKAPVLREAPPYIPPLEDSFVGHTPGEAWRDFGNETVKYGEWPIERNERITGRARFTAVPARSKPSSSSVMSSPLDTSESVLQPNVPVGRARQRGVPKRFMFSEVMKKYNTSQSPT